MLGLVEPKPSREESVKEFVERHLGRSLLWVHYCLNGGVVSNR
jgi:hypothetical protein